MCQIKSNQNINVFAGIIDRDQKIIPTYSRTKKARRSVSALSPHSTNFMPNKVYNSTEITWTSQSQINYHTNCDYIRNVDKIKRSERCDKEMMTSNMDQSSCFLTNSQRFDHKNSNNNDRNESIRMFNSSSSSSSQHFQLENTPFSNMNVQRNLSTHRNRTAKRFGSTSKSREKLNIWEKNTNQHEHKQWFTNLNKKFFIYNRI